MNPIKIVVGLSLLGVACMATALSARSSSAGSAFSQGVAVANMPQTVPPPPPRPKPSKVAPSADEAFLG
jgi:hypothetical protein